MQLLCTIRPGAFQMRSNDGRQLPRSVSSDGGSIWSGERISEQRGEYAASSSGMKLSRPVADSDDDCVKVFMILI